MNAGQWQPLGSVDPRSLGKARRLALNLVQWPARIAYSYLNAEPAARRLVLRWVPERAAMTTGEFAGAIALEMCFPTLQLQFTEGGKLMPHRMDPVEHSPAEIEAWILVELLHRRLDRDTFSKTLPYEIADLMTGDAEQYAPDGCGSELAELSAWYHNAALVFADVAREAHVPSEPKALIECWPQSLDMTRVVSNVRIGFSPGRDEDPEPYFYVTPASSDGLPTKRPRTALGSAQILEANAPAAALADFLRTAAAQAT